MSKQDLGSKLKARLGEWEAYGDQPIPLSQLNPDQRGPDNAGSTVSEPNEIGALVPVMETSNSEPSLHAQRDNGHVPRRLHAESSYSGTTMHANPVLVEAQVAKLQAAIEHEQDQSQRLIDVGVREQVLHAVTWRARTQPPPASRRMPDSRIKIVENPGQMRGANTSLKTNIAWIIVALFIALGCTFFVYTLIR